MRSFLGLCFYDQRFVKVFTSIASHLYRLTEKGRAFAWTEKCDVAFQRLKQALTEVTIVAYTTLEDSFVLDRDASNQGVGAVLSQVQEGKEKVIVYYSRALTKSERRYCVTRRELLAVVVDMSHFHLYLYASKCQQIMEHWINPGFWETSLV